MKHLILSAAAALGLMGCMATDGSGPAPIAPTDAQRQIVADLGVEVAVLRFIGDSPSRADQVRTTAELVGALLEGGEIDTVGGLQAAVDGRIDWAGLSPTEQALGRAIIALIAQDVARLAGGATGPLTPAMQAKVVHYLEVVERAASIPVPVPRPT